MESDNIKRDLGIAANLHNRFDVDDDQVLNPEQIANILGMNSESVRRWCRSSKLPCYSFGGKYVVMGSDFKKFMMAARKLTKAEKEMLQ